MSLIVKSCQCKSKFQDVKYGQGMRVHTEGGTKDKRKYRYTVCGNEITGFVQQETEKMKTKTKKGK